MDIKRNLDLFTQYYQLGHKLDQIYHPPYFLNIKLSNADNNESIELSSPKVNEFHKLPQNLITIMNNYELMKHYILSFSEEYYLHFDIRFISANSYFDQFFNLSVQELKTYLL